MPSTTAIQWYQRESCPSCSGKAWRKLYSLDSIHVYVCEGCGTRFLNPCLNEFSTAAIYQSSETLKKINPELEHYYEESPEIAWSSVTGRDFQKTLNWLSHRVNGHHILDVASGNGIFLGYAKKIGWQPEGVDPSLDNADKVRAKYQVPVTVSRFLEYDNFDKQFDAITFWDFIEHPPKPSLYLQKVKSHLKPGGILVLATPNVDNFLNDTAEFLYKISGGKLSGSLSRIFTVEHASYFNLRTLTTLLEKNGFKVVHHFKTESHVERYKLPFHLRAAIQFFFFLNRIVGRQNRIVVFAEKVS